ncbi:tumor susceptibility gene 101 protein [Culicoides brevitarsis]|uniref:tumor susceptibility gene 101 protein n=1 Tax=Culicoides brevitarsis TaxID=469753 RepID=UPI00307CB561
MVKERDLQRMLSQANYKQPEATKKDILEAVNQYRALDVQTEHFVFNDGSSKELVNLQGTIPVVYKGTTYHIPVCIWIVDTHPHNAPMCYVKPTADMHIKVSRFCDHNGKVYLPYLHDWSPSESDLLGLIQVLIITFGEYMPVYSKPKNQIPPQTTPYPSQPYMPQPQAGSFGGYPGVGYPPVQPNPTNTPYPPAFPGMPSPFMPMPGAQASGYNPNPYNAGTITEEHIKASLISAVEDKVRRRLQERVNQIQAEIQTLNRTKQELSEGQNKIKEIIRKLEAEKVELTKSLEILKEKDAEVDKGLELAEKAEEVNIDEVVVTTAPLYRQLLRAYCEEAAIEDAIYYLGEALRKNVIDLEVFLKYVRQLARRQFTLRALMQKCRQKAGLAC